jgi:NAD(P)H dehydrogenase (quinone)
MSTVVIGATGNFGGLAIDALIRRGVEPARIVAAGRNPDRLAERADSGVGTARVDLDDPATIRAAFEDARKVLLVSVPGSERRVAQHRNAIDAAKAAGVELIAYTSWTHADSCSMRVAVDHKATEQALHDSGLSTAVLRCPPYMESRTRWIPSWRQAGQIVGAAGDGRISAASRADLADAAAAVLATPGHNGGVYELGGDDPFTMSEFAAELSRQTGDDIPYVNLSLDDYKASLVDAGYPDAVVTNLADADRAVAAGEMLIDATDLRRLVGRPLTTLTEAIAEALR